MQKPDPGKAGLVDKDVAKMKSDLNQIISACDAPADQVMSAMAGTFAVLCLR